MLMSNNAFERAEKHRGPQRQAASGPAAQLGR
jgi:hypothetical protein